MDQGIRKNLQLYPWYQAATGFLAWLPIFFLFFFERVSLAEALQLSAVYYFGVFLFEVPSGYFSDKYGRRVTLLLSSLFACLAYFLFITASGYVQLALAQLMLAFFFSFKSGSDSSLLYDSLKSLGEDERYADMEARALRFSLTAMALAALLGGMSGLMDLRLPYVLSLAAALSSVYFCLKFTEPPGLGCAASFFSQLGRCASSLANRQLLWIFLFFVLAYSAQHVVAEFSQPFIKLLQTDWFQQSDISPLVSGVMVAISMFLGAFGAGISIRLMKLMGAQKLLMTGLLIMTAIIAVMALWLHPLVLLLVLMRNFSMALSEAPMLATIAPQIESSYRATYLSLQSLAGRLGFSILLFFLSTKLLVEDSSAGISWATLQLVLLISLAVALCGSLMLWLFQGDN